MRFFLPDLLALAILLAPAALAAQAPQTPTGSLILDQNRADRTTPAPPTPPGKAPRPAPGRIAAGDSGAAIAIAGVRFEGTRVPATVAAAAQPFVGRHADHATLAALVAAMSAAYAHVDVALYTIAVPAQDFAGGVVRVVVAEGHVDAVRLTGDKRDRKLVGRYAEAIRHEAPLRRTTLQRYLSLMRDIPGLKLDAQLVAGTTRGGVILQLGLAHRRPDVITSFDNRTTRLFRNGEFGATLRFYGLLRDGDQTDLIAASSLDLKGYRYLAINHSSALGTNGLRASISAGILRTRPYKLPIKGDAKLASVGLTYPLIRSDKSNLTLSASIDGLNSDNAALGAIIASEHTRAGRFAAGYSYAGTKRIVSISATLSRGLDILGARTIEPLSEPVFTKVNGRVALDQALGRRAVLRLRGSAQWTNDRLPAGERFSVGGAEFGRAFETSVVTTDRGAAGSAELAWRPIGGKLFSGTEVYGFADDARVRLVPRGQFTGATYGLSSAGGGLRLAYKERGAISVEAAHALERPAPGLGDKWRFSIGWRVSFGKP